MKHLHEYRDPDSARELIDSLRPRVSRRWRIMEVCGGQTHGLLKHGIGVALKEEVELVHGPGCPVCVTPVEVIDLAIEAALLPGAVLMTFGDMLRVPGSQGTLSQARTHGGFVRTVYSPIEAVTYAAAHPEVEVVFLAIGFETTIPASALALLQADRLQLKNFSLLSSHVRVFPAMRVLLEQNATGIDAFLAAGHVCTITGFEEYQELAQAFQKPIAITGFEPLDLLRGLQACLELLEQGKIDVVNCYERSARLTGNSSARAMIDQVFEIADTPWRGMGVLPAGGYRLREAWRSFDAQQRLNLRGTATAAGDCSACRSVEVLQGLIKPTECAAFGKECQPDHPLGAPMVSSEGACAAYYHYHAVLTNPTPDSAGSFGGSP